MYWTFDLVREVAPDGAEIAKIRDPGAEGRSSAKFTLSFPMPQVGMDYYVERKRQRHGDASELGG